MRELKLRAYIDECGQKSFAFIDLNNTNTDELARFHVVTNKFGVIKEQYTGLKDKNGKEIYEGDIVTFMVELFDSVTLGLDNEEWHTAVVEWSQDDACYSFVDGDDPFSVQFEAEVIGNIHELNMEELCPKE